MKRFFSTILVLSCISTYGQRYFSLNSRHSSFITPISLNGNEYKIDTTFTKLKTNYPAFDTLRFLDGSWRDGTPIVCNFKPDSSYSIFVNCCATLDIALSWKFSVDSFKIWDYELDFDKYQNVLMDKPFITFKIKNGTVQDSIYAWYSDHACFPSFKLIDEKGWEYGPPVKCFYWNNVSPLVFFKSKEDYTAYTNESGIVLDVFPDKSTELGRIYIRLFDNERYVVTYDVKKKKVSLKRDK